METKNQYRFNEEEHLHTLDGKSLVGTSSVEDVLNKPLAYWASGKAMERFGWKNKKEVSKVEERVVIQEPYRIALKNMTPEEYDAYLDSAYRAHAEFTKDSATKGTDLHAVLEVWVKARMRGEDPEPDPRIVSFVEWCKVNVKRFLWSEVNVYSKKYWLGGISDVGVELNDGRIGILDFKSSKDAYFAHFVQCGGYSIQLEENDGGFDNDGNRVLTLGKPINFIGVVPFGNKDKTPRITNDVKGFQNSFLATLRLYQHQKQIKENGN